MGDSAKETWGRGLMGDENRGIEAYELGHYVEISKGSLPVEVPHFGHLNHHNIS